tara:strand:+ start:159 stop:476 length:318 start_codon:yes stop_codon:yes gene_type:complete
MKTGTVNSTNKMVHDGSKGQKVTIIKSFFCNGEGHYLTKEIGEIPDMFVDETLSEKEMIHILKNKLIGECTKSEEKQVMNFAFGEEFMESDDKGSKVIYNQRKNG